MDLIHIPHLLAPLTRASAYLDPGSGSFILQLILASAVGVMFALRSYWSRIANGVKNLFSRTEETAPDDHE